ncbi:hypothetical protein [Streptomyces doebereineriae]|uniref:Uncharacterized protein n=1 Tax=Streptomyces doebereineriae TaxID=3075528 RepID=A0ABU2VRB6_9ACTN|nr:hypothetical protein [Streptomyces sp. DSM 41640]MDT0488165.1 hypothetical protein [Streptomyces sp. DSM 41640]
MIAVLLVALVILALVVWRAMDRATQADVTGIVRTAAAAIVTLVLTYVALRVVPPEVVPDLLSTALRALKTA